MTTSGTGTTTLPFLRRLTRPAAVLLLVAAVAWTAVVAIAHRMSGMTGTMGLGPAGFAGMWLLMMAAMMLPSVAPVASMYQRSLRSHRVLRLSGFTAGYLLAWGAAGIVAYVPALLVEQSVAGRPGVATSVAVGVFAACGLYQFTPLKTRCLRHCRSPLSLLLHYGSYRGRLRDLRVGLHHGAFCLGCCWALMIVFVAVGVMNVPAMVVLAAVVLAEKVSRHGELMARLAGGAALVAAVAVVWFPALAPGVLAGEPMGG
jgi:predicted metal-binding membrane protein